MPLLALVLLAAALRFPGLDAQSFWHDEAFTVPLVEGSFGELVDGIGDTESTPPVYYVLAWIWEKLFGSGEVGLRSLSAVFGVALVPVAYLIGRELAGRRAALLAGGLVAVSPYLVWYSQEARSYGLYALLTALSFLFFVRALERGDRRWFGWWALASGLAIGTHYFAGYIVAVEAVWLLVATRRSRDALTAVGGVLLACALLAPLALSQRASGRTDWVDETSLAGRAVDTAKRFLSGPFGVPEDAVAALAALLVLAGAVLLFMRAERRGLVAVGVGVAAIAIPFVLALLGFDYFFDHYVIAALVPLLCAVAAGLAAAPRRWALGLGAALCVVLGAITIVQQFDEELHRDDWREVAATLGPGERAIVVDRLGSKPLELYLGADELRPEGVAVAELALAESFRFGDERDPPPPEVPGFRLDEQREGPTYRLFTYRAEQPVLVTRHSLAAFGLDDETFFLQDAP